MLYPIYGNHPPMWKEGMDLRQIAVIIGQLLDMDTLDRFKGEVDKSPLPEQVKRVVHKEFHDKCSISESVLYMMHHHIKDVSSTGFAFDWVLRNKELRKKRIGQ